MKAREIAKEIMNLDSFDTYRAWNEGIASETHLAEIIVNDPESVTEWLSETINTIDSGDNLGDDNADDLMELIISINELHGIE